MGRDERHGLANDNVTAKVQPIASFDAYLDERYSKLRMGATLLREAASQETSYESSHDHHSK